MRSKVQICVRSCSKSGGTLAALKTAFMCRPRATQERAASLWAASSPDWAASSPAEHSLESTCRGPGGLADRCANAELTMRDLTFGFRHDVKKYQRCQTALPQGQNCSHVCGARWSAT
jgi:hypothetical protein